MPVSRLARVVRVATTATLFAGVAALSASSGCSSASNPGFGIGPDGGMITTNPDSSIVGGNDATTPKDAPIMLTVIDREEQIERLIPHLDVMVEEGLIAMSRVEVIRYSRTSTNEKVKIEQDPDGDDGSLRDAGI